MHNLYVGDDLILPTSAKVATLVCYPKSPKKSIHYIESADSQAGTTAQNIPRRITLPIQLLQKNTAAVAIDLKYTERNDGGSRCKVQPVVRDLERNTDRRFGQKIRQRVITNNRQVNTVIGPVASRAGQQIITQGLQVAFGGRC